MNKKIERILKLAAANGIALNKNFNLSYLSTHGFYEGPQTLAENCVDEMERLCFLGMNNGFDSNLKSAVDKLSDVVINLTSVKNGDLRELSKLEAQKNKILDGASKVSYSAKLDVRDPVREYIASSVDAIDTMLSLKGKGEVFQFIAKDQITYMEESKKKLAELSLLLVTAMDVGSVKAKENAEKIIELLKEWRKFCSNKILTSGSVKLIDDAISVARDWNNITVAPTKKEKAKDVPAYEKDDLTSIARGRNVLETLNVFNARIQSQLAENDKKMADLNKDKEKVTALRNEYAGLENRKVQVAKELKNTGDVAKANREIALIRQRGVELQDEIRALDSNKRIAIREQSLRASREITLNIKYICDMLNDNNGDLSFLAKVIDKVDFNSLVGYMMGKTSDLNAANESILQIKTRVEAVRRNILNNAEVLRDDEEITNSVLFEGYNLEEDDLHLNENGVDDELAKLLESLNDGEKQEEQPDENRTVLKKVIPLGDDDK